MNRRTTMLRLLSRILDALSFDAPVVACDPDPIEHSVFRGMSLRDLADLPFPRPTSRGEDEDAVGAHVPQLSEPNAIRAAA
jgi:hypothetical protein